MIAVTVAVFSQIAAPVLILVFLPLLLVAFRLSRSWAAFSMLIVAFIGGAPTLNAYGRITLSRVGPSQWHDPNLLPVLRILPVFQLFTTAVLCVALTASTIEPHSPAERPAKTSAIVDVPTIMPSPLPASRQLLSR